MINRALLNFWNRQRHWVSLACRLEENRYRYPRMQKRRFQRVR